MTGSVSDRGGHRMSINDDGFPRLPESVYEAWHSRDRTRVYAQFPLPHPKDIAAGNVFGHNFPDHLWSAIDAKPARTDAQENIRLREIIDQLLDQVRVMTLKYNLARWKAEHRAILDANANDPNNPFASNSNDGVARGIVPPPPPRNNGFTVRRPPPVSPTKQRSPIEPPIMDSIHYSGRRQKPKHKRTETPEQLHLKPFMQSPVYTHGIDPQCTRGLLHDYFEDIRKWTGFYVKGSSVGQPKKYSTLPGIGRMLGGMSDVEHMLADRETRRDLFAGFIIHRIVHYALGESGLANSGHEASGECTQLFREYTSIPAESFLHKHEACLRQQALYTKLKIDVRHKEWRTRAAEKRTEELLSEISCVLEPGSHPERDHILTELYIKGYRIGFRLRMEAVKWQIVWPVAGTDVNLKCMINQTRNLFGDPATTFMRLSENQERFFVRFALTPTFIRADYSSGVEVKDVIHSSLVHVGVRNVFSHIHDAQLCCLC